MIPTQPLITAPLIEQAEAGIVRLLWPLSTAGLEVLTPTQLADVEVLPENKAGIEDALVRPRVTVAYRQSTFGESKDAPLFAGLGSAAAQEETVHIDILVRARGRKTDAGVYPVIHAVRGLLLGITPFPGARALVFTGQQLDDFEDRGGWRYMLSVSTSTVIVSTNELPEALVAGLRFYWDLVPGPQ